MSTTTTMSLYLGASEEGIRNGRLIKEYAAKRGMKKSEYVLYCVLQQIEREEALKAAEG